MTDLLSTVGKNFKTDLQSNEIVSLVKIVADIDNSDTTSAILDNSPSGPLVSSTNSLGQYVLIPKLGESDWSEVHQFAATAMSEPYLLKKDITYPHFTLRALPMVNTISSVELVVLLAEGDRPKRRLSRARV